MRERIIGRRGRTTKTDQRERPGKPGARPGKPGARPPRKASGPVLERVRPRPAGAPPPFRPKAPVVKFVHKKAPSPPRPQFDIPFAPKNVTSFPAKTWLWLCRGGSEIDLVEELLLSQKGMEAEPISVGLVRSSSRPFRHGQPYELTFARQGFPVIAVVRGETPVALGMAAARVVAPMLAEGPYVLHGFTPDADKLNPLSNDVAAAGSALARSLPGGAARLVSAVDSPLAKSSFVQLCMLGPGVAAVGVQRVGQAVSLAPGGRLRASQGRAPSRAAAKLLEAFAWMGRTPEPGDVCLDLGAAPGGWTHVLLDLRCKVTAVDPARMSPELMKNRLLTHERRSAFDYAREEPVDWLFCDMAWRPLEVAALLARWGRQRMARFLVANIKLPMKRKVEMLTRVREILETGMWRDVHVRQLYHDRDEVTIYAWALGDP